jgi:hypothetical protein
MNEKPNRELALELLQRLIDLEAERLAMAGILILAKTQDGQPLDWKNIVKSDCGPFGKSRDIVRRNFAKLEEQLQSSTPDCADALSLLGSIPSNPIWELAI